jgi:methylated-DNA-protein-cysteine methyltransferase related protein
MPQTTTYARIYAVVRRIPYGRVATYGQIAELAGLPGHARQVGYALHALPDATALPWHRVVNASGGISLRRARIGNEMVQQRLLEDEGVEFDLRGRVRLAAAQWRPGGKATSRQSATGKARRVKAARGAGRSRRLDA